MGGGWGVVRGRWATYIVGRGALPVLSLSIPEHSRVDHWAYCAQTVSVFEVSELCVY